MAYRAPFGARSTTTGCGRSSASNQGGGAAGEWPESGRRRPLAAAGVRRGAALRLGFTGEGSEQGSDEGRRSGARLLQGSNERSTGSARAAAMAEQSFGRRWSRG